MRILVLADRPPHPYVAGGDQLLFHRLRPLAERHIITVAYLNWENEPAATDPSALFPYTLREIPPPPASIAPPHVQPTRRASFYEAWRHTLTDADPYFVYGRRQQQLGAKIRELVAQANPDIVHVLGLTMLYGTPPLDVPIVAEVVDMWSRSHWVHSRPPKPTHRFQYWLEGKKVERIERKELRRAAAVLVVSELEAETARSIAPGVPVHVIPPAVDLGTMNQLTPPRELAHLLFVGAMSYPPNADAARYFATSIFPLVRDPVPHAQFWIVGRTPSPAVLAIASDHIHICADVTDIRPYYQQSGIVVVPLLHGGGVRTKIMEAWALGRPVVSTTRGAEGLDARDGENLRLADSPTKFAAAILDLIREPSQATALVERGRRTVETHYSLASTSARLDNLYADFVRQT